MILSIEPIETLFFKDLVVVPLYSYLQVHVLCSTSVVAESCAVLFHADSLNIDFI